MIPVLAATGFMVGLGGIGGIAFGALAGFMLFGTLHLARVWDEGG